MKNSNSNAGALHAGAPILKEIVFLPSLPQLQSFVLDGKEYINAAYEKFALELFRELNGDQQTPAANAVRSMLLTQDVQEV